MHLIFAHIFMGMILLGLIYWGIMLIVVAIQAARGKDFGRVPWWWL